MSLLTVKGRLLRWGNSFGLRLGRHDVERLRLQPGAEIRVKVEVGGRAMRPRDARTFSLGGSAADEHDALAAGSAIEDLDEGR